MSTSGLQLKLDGLEAVADKYGPDMVKAQLVAQLIGMHGEIITIEDVRDAFRQNYGYELRIGNAFGAIFRDGQWEHKGYCKAKRPEAHARTISMWGLKNGRI